MNNLSVFQKIIEEISSNQTTSNNWIFALIIFIGLNILLTLINIFFQFKLKNKEKEINRFNLLENKRIECQETLYEMLELLTYFDGSQQEKNDFQKNISEINKFLTKRKLFLNKKIIKTSLKFVDYNTQVLVDYRKKNYEKEMTLLEEFNTLFNDPKS